MSRNLLFTRMISAISLLLLICSLFCIGELIDRYHFLKRHSIDREKSYGKLLARQSFKDVDRARFLLQQTAPRIPSNQSVLSKLKYSNTFVAKELHDLLMDSFDAEARKMKAEGCVSNTLSLGCECRFKHYYSD